MPNPSAPPGKEWKYAREERERRFLLQSIPDQTVTRTVTITDRYISGTRIRLRRMVEDHRPAVYKLTQKVAADSSEPGMITTMYLNDEEYSLMARLPALEMCKTRHSVPPIGIDEFSGALRGLFIAEVEFETDEEMAAFTPPRWAIAEVTEDARLAGGNLVGTTATELAAITAGYGLILPGEPSEGSFR